MFSEHYAISECKNQFPHILLQTVLPYFSEGGFPMKKKTKTLLICLAIPLAVGAVSGWLTRNSMDTFKLLDKPSLAPSGWVFPVAWTILYVLMGIASYLVCTAKQSECRRDGLIVYAAQLAVNFFWPMFFFLGQWYFFSFVWLVLLWFLVLVTIRFFYAVNKNAGYLPIPYLAWVTFAGYLNFFISIMNP